MEGKLSRSSPSALTVTTLVLLMSLDNLRPHRAGWRLFVGSFISIEVVNQLSGRCMLCRVLSAGLLSERV